jgi:hypothetical protein
MKAQCSQRMICFRAGVEPETCENCDYEPRTNEQIIEQRKKYYKYVKKSRGQSK